MCTCFILCRHISPLPLAFCQTSVHAYLAVIIVFIVTTSLVFASPLRDEAGDQLNPFERRSCGGRLAERVNQICQERGGHKTYTNVVPLEHVTHLRRRRNIANECCVNKCLDEYIAQTYCNNVNKIAGNRKTTILTTPSVIMPLTKTTPSPTNFIEDAPLDVTESSIYKHKIIQSRATDTKKFKTEIKMLFTSTPTPAPGYTTETKHSPYTLGTVPPEFFKRPILASRSRRFF